MEPKFVSLCSFSIGEDVEKAKRISTLLYSLYSQRSGFFEGYKMPEYIDPTTNIGAKELALYLTYIISIDYQTNAERLWEKARRAFRSNPEMFTPEKVITTDKGALEHFVRSLGARFPSNGAKAWREISRILLDDFEGTPLNLTRKPMTVISLRHVISQFPYLRGRKLSNFYMRVMYEKKFFKIIDPQNIPVAPDIQVCRISFYTGVLKMIGGSNVDIGRNSIRNQVEHVWSEATKNWGIPAAYLDEPLWTIGSKLCANKQCSPCPLKDICEKNFSVTFRV